MPSSQSPPDDSLRMEGGRPWTRRHWILLCVGGTFLLIIVPGISVFLPIWDISPVEDSDMMVAPTPVPKEQNAWPELVELYHDLQPSLPDTFNRWWRYSDSHQDAIEAWVRNISLQESLQFLHEKPFCHPPFTHKKDEWHDEDIILVFFHRIFRLMLVTSDAPIDTYQALSLHLRFMTAVHSGPKTSFGLVIHNFYLQECVDDILTHSGLADYSLQQLREMSRMFEDLETDWDDAWKWAIIRDYRYVATHLPETDAKEFWDGNPVPWITRKFSLPFLYQQQRTLALFLESHRAMLYRVTPEEFPYPQARTPAELHQDVMAAGNTAADEFLTFARLLPNINGTLLFTEFTGSSFERRDRTENREAWSLNAIQIVLNLLQYQKKHGHLPERLEDPRLGLPTDMLIDPYNGKPIQYRPSERLFYSVGQNGTDDGGEVSDSRYEGDSVIKIPLVH